jgi:outer membrane protein assembly factor BamB
MTASLNVGWMIAALLMAGPGETDGQHWPRFRGPNGSGESDADSIPLQWTAKDYRWNVELPGEGHSSPVVWGDRVVVTAASKDGARWHVIALRTTDGARLWETTREAGTYPKSQLNSYASTTPALDGQRVFVTWGTPRHYMVAALALENGRKLWQREFPPFASEHGLGASPIVWNDVVIVPNDQDGPSSVIALDVATGATRWEVQRRSEKAAFSTPCVFQAPNGKPQLILSSWAHGVSGLDPATGETLWELPVFQFRTVGSPTVAAGLIFASAGVGGVGRQMVAIRPGDPDARAKPSVAYHIENPFPYVPVPVAKGNLVFLWQDRGMVTCLDGPSGKVHWRQRVGGDYFSSPIRVADRIYCPTRNGEMVVLAASERFQQLARFPLGDKTHSTPAVAGGVLYVRTFSRLAAIGGGQNATAREE